MEPVGPMGEQRSRWHGFLDWTTDHTLIIAVLFDFIIIVATLIGFQHYNDANIQRAKNQAIQEANDRAADVTAATTETCKRAVIAVTEQGKADDLKLIQAIEQRFVEAGKPTPAIYLNLELLITNRQPPTAACEPKESP